MEVPQWIARNHESLLSAVHPIAQAIRSACDVPHAELEFRLGVDCGGNFRSDVGFSVHDDFVRLCSGGAEPTSLHFGEWVQIVTHYYTIGDRQVRTRVDARSDSLSVRAVTIAKRRLHRCEVRCRGTPWRVRVDLSEEPPVPVDQLPETVLPTRVTITHRSSATYGGTEEAPLWRYDLSVVWHGRTRTEAEARQRDESVAPEYMLELEYIGGPAGLAEHGAEYLACSGLLKILDTVGLTSATCDVVAPASPGQSN